MWKRVQNSLKFLYKGAIITIVINTLTKPLTLGFYKNNKLIETKEYKGMTSDILLEILFTVLKQYDVKRVIYTNGPGSHMATKISYVLLKTLYIIKEIPIFAVSGFELNNNMPIKALGKLYFIKEKETIIVKRFKTEPNTSFFMPDFLDSVKLQKTIEPNYQISAI